VTLVADAAPDTEPKVETAAPPKTNANRPVPVVVGLVCMVVALAVCWSLLALTEGPFGRIWYNTRQHHRASALSVGHSKVFPGQALGVLQIPVLGVNLVVQEGDGVSALRGGPGHHIGTPRPGQIGNSVIVGHRHGWGAPFAKIAALKPNDLIVFQNAHDTLHPWVFKVRTVQSGVAADDPAPFAHSDDHRLTLVTGSGGRFSDSRLVVTAVSGAATKRKLAFGPEVSPTIARVSTLTNNGVLLMIVGAVLGLVAFVLTRRRYRVATLALVATPFVALFLIGLLLEFDYALPALH